MDYEKLKKRDTSLDILRIIAVFTVLSVHFFLHNGFYSQTIEVGRAEAFAGKNSVIRSAADGLGMGKTVLCWLMAWNMRLL